MELITKRLISNFIYYGLFLNIREYKLLLLFFSVYNDSITVKINYCRRYLL